MDNRSEEFIGLLTGAQPALSGFVLSLIHDRTAARDVLQEVNLTLWRKADGFAPGTNFFAWACRVSQFHVMNHRRSMARNRLVFDDELCLQLAELQVEHAQANDRRAETLKDCLEKLPAEQRELVARRYAQDGSVQTLAEEQGRTVGARVADKLTFDVKCFNPQARIATALPVEWAGAEERAQNREGKLRGGGPKLELHSTGAGVWLEELGDAKLPDVTKEFAFFQPGQRPVEQNVARQAPRDARGILKDEFIIDAKSGPLLAAGLILPDGTQVPAEIISADDTQVVFRRTEATAESWLLSRVAVVLFRPVPEAKLAALHRTATGLLLRNGDFLEADLRTLEKGEVAMSSVLFGIRTVNVEKGAVALVLRAFKEKQPDAVPPK